MDLFTAGAHVLKQLQTLRAIPQLHYEYASAGFVLLHNLRAQMEQHQSSLNETADERS
jgi:hypothetical protein